MKLDARLQAAADAAGRCALFADIGSDHAKLALYLLETGAAARAVCADIHAAPLARSRLPRARGWRIGRPSSCPTGWTRCPSGRTSPRSAGWAGS